MREGEREHSPGHAKALTQPGLNVHIWFSTFVGSYFFFGRLPEHRPNNVLDERYTTWFSTAVYIEELKPSRHELGTLCGSSNPKRCWQKVPREPSGKERDRTRQAHQGSPVGVETNAPSGYPFLSVVVHVFSDWKDHRTSMTTVTKKAKYFGDG